MANLTDNNGRKFRYPLVGDGKKRLFQCGECPYKYIGLWPSMRMQEHYRSWHPDVDHLTTKRKAESDICHLSAREEYEWKCHICGCGMRKGVSDGCKHPELRNRLARRQHYLREHNVSAPRFTKVRDDKKRYQTILRQAVNKRRGGHITKAIIELKDTHGEVRLWWRPHRDDGKKKSKL